MLQYPTGSQWRRWDIQIHSPLSILNNQFPHQEGTGEPNWGRYVSRLEAKRLAVIGVTDYFTIAGYKALQEIQTAGRLKGVTLLPNIEFRLDKFISARSDGKDPRRLNLHVIFSQDVSLTDMEDHFLHELKFNYENTPGEKSERLTLKAANLQQLGERLKKEEESFQQFTSLEVGAMTAVVSFEEIVEHLAGDSRFRGRYLIALPAENWDQIPWTGQDHLARKLLLKGAHFLLASNPNTVAWCLGKPPYMEGVDQFVREFGALKPCVWGSEPIPWSSSATPAPNGAWRGTPVPTIRRTANCAVAG